MLDTSDTMAFSPLAGNGESTERTQPGLRVARRRCDMAAGIQGADLAQLQHLVQQLGGPFQSELQATLNGMNQKVQASSAYWVARNGDQFRADFAQFVSKCEQQLNQILQEAAKASGQHLQAIRTATGSAILRPLAATGMPHGHTPWPSRPAQ